MLVHIQRKNSFENILTMYLYTSDSSPTCKLQPTHPKKKFNILGQQVEDQPVASKLNFT